MSRRSDGGLGLDCAGLVDQIAAFFSTSASGCAGRFFCQERPRLCGNFDLRCSLQPVFDPFSTMRQLECRHEAARLWASVCPFVPNGRTKSLLSYRSGESHYRLGCIAERPDGARRACRTGHRHRRSCRPPMSVSGPSARPCRAPPSRRQRRSAAGPTRCRTPCIKQRQRQFDNIRASLGAADQRSSGMRRRSPQLQPRPRPIARACPNWPPRSRPPFLEAAPCAPCDNTGAGASPTASNGPSSACSASARVVIDLARPFRQRLRTASGARHHFRLQSWTRASPKLDHGTEVVGGSSALLLQPILAGSGRHATPPVGPIG